MSFFFQDQYTFVYKALLEAIKVGSTSCSADDFPGIYQEGLSPENSSVENQYVVSIVMYTCLIKIFRMVILT